MPPKRKASTLAEEPRAKRTKSATSSNTKSAVAVKTAELVKKSKAAPTKKPTKLAASSAGSRSKNPRSAASSAVSNKRKSPTMAGPKVKKMKKNDYASMSVAELKEELAARGLAKTGNKADLVARLTNTGKANASKKVPKAPASKDWSKEYVPAIKQELEARGLATTGKKADLVAHLQGDGSGRAGVKVTAKPKPGRKPKVAAEPKPDLPKPYKFGPTINHAPTTKLDVYVFGEGSAGELGLGAFSFEGKAPLDVKRPRLNHLLKAGTVGVVAIAVGGMHAAALTHDNKILTWGVNDNGALGREVEAGGKMIDLKEDGAEAEDSDSDDDDSGLNPNEAEPRQVDPKYFPEGTVFVGLLATDSATFALTQDGAVYGWGTFRGNDGDMGFRAGKNKGESQRTPIHITELKKIVALAGGTNHVLALDNKGKVFTFGAGEQNQMGRRTVARHAHAALIPREFGLQRKNIVKLGCGDYNSFAVDKDGKVYAWGLNSFGQTGINIEDGDDNDTIPAPTQVKKLEGYKIKEITGGAHHTLSITEEGKVLIWGSIQNGQGGMDYQAVPKHVLFRDDAGEARYLIEPVELPDVTGKSISCGPDHCLLITEDNEAWSWGFNENYQCGQGGGEDKIMEATPIENSAIEGKKLVFVGAGGQFGILAGEPQNP
ncbi:putative mitochondrial protein Fmp25 [Calycina marina]|uniref:Mitochondrial protein Fmp25 n=1 Tax=Calycina marina TaxID=1763456 RepID=A0A9P7Z5C7_9HELO|nr:putative mitochondrial protein Fmp25 [Calycina marina]